MATMQSFKSAGETLEFAIFSLVVQTFFFGLYTVLVFLSIRMLLKRGLTIQSTRVMFYTILFMCLLSTAYWAYSIADVADRISAFIHAAPSTFGTIKIADQDAVSEWLSLASAVLLINHVLAEGVVIWRAWVVCRHNLRKVFWLAILLLVLTALAVIVNVGFEIAALFQSSIGKLPKNSFAGKMLNILQILITSLLLTSNATASIVVLATARRYRKSQPAQPVRTRLLLAESGLLLFLALLTTALVSLSRLSDFENLFVSLSVHLAGAYPSLVILLLGTKRSLNDTIFKAEPSGEKAVGIGGATPGSMFPSPTSTITPVNEPLDILRSRGSLKATAPAMSGHVHTGSSSSTLVPVKETLEPEDGFRRPVKMDQTQRAEEIGVAYSVPQPTVVPGREPSVRRPVQVPITKAPAETGSGTEPLNPVGSVRKPVKPASTAEPTRKAAEIGVAYLSTKPTVVPGREPSVRKPAEMKSTPASKPTPTRAGSPSSALALGTEPLATVQRPVKPDLAVTTEVGGSNKSRSRRATGISGEQSVRKAPEVELPLLPVTDDSASEFTIEAYMTNVTVPEVTLTEPVKGLDARKSSRTNLNSKAAVAEGDIGGPFKPTGTSSERARRPSEASQPANRKTVEKRDAGYGSESSYTSGTNSEQRARRPSGANSTNRTVVAQSNSGSESVYTPKPTSATASIPVTDFELGIRRPVKVKSVPNLKALERRGHSRAGSSVSSTEPVDTARKQPSTAKLPSTPRTRSQERIGHRYSRSAGSLGVAKRTEPVNLTGTSTLRPVTGSLTPNRKEPEVSGSTYSYTAVSVASEPLDIVGNRSSLIIADAKPAQPSRFSDDSFS